MKAAVHIHDLARLNAPAAQWDFERWWHCPGDNISRHRTGDVTILRTRNTRLLFDVVRKTYSYPTFRDRRRGWFRNTLLAPSRVAREAAHLRTLERLSLNPPLLIGFGEQRRRGLLFDSFLLTRLWPGRNLEQFFDDSPTIDQRRHLASQLGRFIGTMHRQGAIDRDLHLRNLLVDENGSLCKIDSPRAALVSTWRVRRLRSRDWRDLVPELKDRLTTREWLRCVRSYQRAYANGSGVSLTSLASSEPWCREQK